MTSAPATDVNGVVLGDTPAGVPHLTVPFTIGPDGTAATVEQDTQPEVVQSVAMLCGTTPGTRLMVPGYGLDDMTFVPADRAPGMIRLAVAEWEPRAAVTVSVTPGAAEQVVVEVTGGSPA